MHEIGHALGLKHPFDSGASGIAFVGDTLFALGDNHAVFAVGFGLVYIVAGDDGLRQAHAFLDAYRAGSISKTWSRPE